jgi:hypothetical protein
VDLKPGTRLRSTVCSTEVVVVRPPAAPVDLRCGGAPMTDPGSPPASAAKGTGEPGTQLGKRYADEDSGLELLCTKPGSGTLSIGDTPIPLKDAKPLPSSD